jgi:TP901 family phage tail tape measure protein
MQPGVRQASRDLDKVRTSAAGATTGLAKTEQSMKRAGATALKFGAALAGGTAALLAIQGIRGSISTIAEFEDVMLAVRGVAIDAGAAVADQAEQFGALEDAARGLGATTRFTATQAGEGLLFLARAGFDVEESISALPATLDLAVAGQLELGRAADIASNVLRQFNLEAEETVRVADVLVAVANNANTNVEQLSQALKFAGPVAGALGQSVEATAAALGTLGNAGIQATLAGTQLRGAFSALLGPTTAARGILDELGLSMEEIDPATRTIEEVFRAFAGTAFDAADAVEIFGRRNAAAALILTANINEVRGLTDEAERLRGEAERVSDIMDSGLVGSARAFASATQELVLQLGEGGLGGAMKSVLDFSTDVLRALGNIQVEGEEAGAAAQFAARSIKLLAVASAAFVSVKIAVAVQAFALQIGTLTAALTLVELKLASTFALLAAHPFGAAAIGLTTLVSAFLIFGPEVEFAERTTQSFIGTLVELDDTIDRFTTNEARLRRALEIGDAELAMEALADRAAELETVVIDLRRQMQGLLESQSANVPLRGVEESLRAFVEIEEVVDRIGDVDVEALARDLGERYVENFLAELVAIEGGDFEESLRRSQENLVLGGAFEATGGLAGRDFASAFVFALADVFRSTGAEFTNVLSEQVRAVQDAGVFDQVLEGALDRSQLERVPLLEFIRLVEEEITSLRAASIDDVGEILGITDETDLARIEALLGQVDAQQKARDAVDEFVASLREEIEWVGKDADEVERLVAAKEIEKQVRELNAAATDEEVAVIRALVVGHVAELQAAEAAAESEERLAKAREKSIEASADLLSNLEKELALVGATSNERELATTLALAEAAAVGMSAEERAAFVEIVRQQVLMLQALRGEYEVLVEAEEAADRAAEEAARKFEAMGSAAAGAFQQAVFHAQSLEQAIRGIVLATAEATFNQFVTQPLASGLADAFGGAFGGGAAKGAVLGGGDFVPSALGNAFRGFALGGLPDLVTEPTLFPLAGGRLGAAGEEGFEAILPLERDPGSGRLGVRSSGGGDGAAVGALAAGQTEQTGLLRRIDRRLAGTTRGSFGRSPRQTQRDLRRTMGL